MVEIRQNVYYMTKYYTEAIRREIGSRLRKIRTEKDLKQWQVADEAKITRSYYSRIEGGTVNLSVEKLFRILAVLNIKSNDVLPF